MTRTNALLAVRSAMILMVSREAKCLNRRDAETQGSSTVSGTEIIVIGARQRGADSIGRKRRTRQMVDGIKGAATPLPQQSKRTPDLGNVPAQLVKSIQVHKARTTDQIEVGIAGSINIGLPRPLDLQKDWTVRLRFPGDQRIPS